ncbi:MAG TPA: hypothetical protein G4O02_03440 [Caldilineae bacterium]|nr:hypothetical protein [Caldilineae bacterium]
MVTPILLVTPTLSEYAAVRAAIADMLPSGNVKLRTCGIGADAVRSLCGRLEDAAGSLRGIALVGWAGGLHPDLAVGDIVLADVTQNLQGQRIPCTVVPLPDAKVGPLLTVSEPLLTPESKEAARGSSALAVEMEAYPLASWAWTHHIPFAHARVILDTADESLPDLGNALDPFGRVHPGHLAWRLLTRPRSIPLLLRLAYRTRVLAPILGRIARAIVQSWPTQSL